MNYDKILIIVLFICIILQSMFIAAIKTEEIKCKEVIVVEQYINVSNISQQRDFIHHLREECNNSSLFS
jgi:hypothetical protein